MMDILTVVLLLGAHMQVGLSQLASDSTGSERVNNSAAAPITAPLVTTESPLAPPSSSVAPEPPTKVVSTLLPEDNAGASDGEVDIVGLTTAGNRVTRTPAAGISCPVCQGTREYCADSDHFTSKTCDPHADHCWMMSRLQPDQTCSNPAAEHFQSGCPEDFVSDDALPKMCSKDHSSMCGLCNDAKDRRACFRCCNDTDWDSPETSEKMFSVCNPFECSGDVTYRASLCTIYGTLLFALIQSL